MHEKLQPVDLAKSYLLLNHGPVVLVSSAFHGRRNVMAASWVMPLDFDPPKVLAVIDGRSFTRELVEASGEFALNLPFKRIADKVLAAGSMSGRDGDKFAHAGLGRFRPVASGHRWYAIARHGWSARSSPRRTTRNVTTCSSPKLLPPGPIPPCFPTGAGISPMQHAARFTTRPAAPSSRPAGPSNALTPSPVRPAGCRSCVAPGAGSRRRTG